MAVDLGTGDGCSVVRAAASDASTLFIGLDPVADRLAVASTAAARRRQSNVLFAMASLESLPTELEGVATQLAVILPWGSLLRAVALPEPNLLAEARRICQSGARLDVVLSSSPRDAKELARLRLPQVDPRCRDALVRGYAEAGFNLCTFEELSMGELRDVGSTWAKRLAREGDRRAWRLVARAR